LAQPWRDGVRSGLSEAAAGGVRQPLQVLGRFAVESQGLGQGLHHLSGWTGVTTLLEAQVVRRADAGQRRHLLATQTRDAASRASR
jgi:hypothetical protein